MFVFAHKKYSRRLIYLRLSHWSHLDYINDLFNNFSGPASFGHTGSLWRSETWLRFHQKYLNLCSEDERRSYAVGTTWGWVITDRILIFGWTNSLTCAPDFHCYLKTMIVIHSCPSLKKHCHFHFSVWRSYKSNRFKPEWGACKDILYSTFT